MSYESWINTGVALGVVLVGIIIGRWLTKREQRLGRIKDEIVDRFPRQGDWR